MSARAVGQSDQNLSDKTVAVAASRRLGLSKKVARASPTRPAFQCWRTRTTYYLVFCYEPCQPRMRCNPGDSIFLGREFSEMAHAAIGPLYLDPPNAALFYGR